jgi:hypothetical protein
MTAFWFVWLAVTLTLAVELAKRTAWGRPWSARMCQKTYKLVCASDADAPMPDVKSDYELAVGMTLIISSSSSEDLPPQTSMWLITKPPSVWIDLDAGGSVGICTVDRLADP